MNLDEQLPGLLAREAEHADAAPPTRAGVQSAIGRRAARRRRQRAVVTGVAALCLVAGVVGGLALAGDDDAQEDGLTTPTDSLPELPVVGLDIDGLSPSHVQTGPVDAAGEPARSAVVFRSGRSLADPFITVSVGRGELRGDPVDLDGDGVTDGGVGGNETGLGIIWRLTDGSIATVSTTVELEQAALRYAREVYSPTLDLDSLPAPEGLPDRHAWTFPDPRGPNESRVTYEADGGTGPGLVVSTSNQPGHFDLLQDSAPLDFGGEPFEELALGPSFLGPGRAIVHDAGGGNAYGLVLTDTGLTIEISAEAVDVDDLRAILTDSAFVEVDPVDGPPTTTALAPATTVSGPATTVVGELTPLPDARRTVDAEGDHIVLEFDDAQPALGAMTVLEELTGACASSTATFTDVIRRDGDEDVTRWRGWLTIEMDTSSPVIEGPVFGGDGYIYCSEQSGASVIALPLTNLGEPTVTPLSGRPAIVIDIPG